MSGNARLSKPRSQAYNRENAVDLTSRGKRTRAALLTAARVVFERDGFLNARITDIADEAGVAHGSFYTYFGSKEDVYQNLALTIRLDIYPDELVASSPLTTHREAVESIERSNRLYLETYQRNAAFMRTFEEVTLYVHDMAKYREARINEGSDRVSRIISALQRHGLASTALDPDYAAIALTAMVSRYTSMWMTDAVDLGIQLDFERSVKNLTLLWAQALELQTADWLADFDSRS